MCGGVFVCLSCSRWLDDVLVTLFASLVDFELLQKDEMANGKDLQNFIRVHAVGVCVFCVRG